MDGFKLETIKDIEKCKGAFFRVSENNYYSDSRNEYVYSTRLRLLKGKSCPGCSRCMFFYEDYSNTGEMPILPEDLNHNAIVELRATNLSRDWETGIIDGWDLEFVEVKE